MLLGFIWFLVSLSGLYLVLPDFDWDLLGFYLFISSLNRFDRV